MKCTAPDPIPNCLLPSVLFFAPTTISDPKEGSLWAFVAALLHPFTSGCHRRRCFTFGLLSLFAAGMTIPLRSQSVGNFCPSGTCDIATPNYINVYWDSSLAQWDSDVAANTTDMAHQHIDDLMDALVHSQYFTNTSIFGSGSVSQYSTTGVSRGPSLSASGCIAAPATLDLAHSQLPTLVNCLLLANPSLNNGQTIFNVFVPPQTAPASPTADFCTKFIGEHDKYGTSVEITFLPTNTACAKSLGALFKTVTHEMVEATTDPVPASPTGWKDGNPGGFYGQEIGDLCQGQSGVSFLYGQVTKYWSDIISGCSSGFLTDVPIVASSSACGTGKNMTFTFSGFFGATPWDLASKKFGNETLYLSLLVAHSGGTWEAGNFEGLPNLPAVNQGKPDQVFLNGVNWTSTQVQAPGFSFGYGITLPTGAVAKVSPGDVITANIFMPDSGQGAAVNITAPSATQLINLVVSPTNFDPWVFVNRQATVSGNVADAQSCGIEEQQVTLSTSGASVTPGQLTTASDGGINATYYAPAVAGTQTVAATTGQGSITSTVNVPVHPIATSIQPAIGPVAGNQKATLTGDGFVVNNTTVAFTGAPASLQKVALKSIQLLTPPSPLPGPDGIADIIATANGLDSLSVPYQYVIPGKPYIEFRPRSCTLNYIVVTVYNDQGKPITVPIQLTASYAAYFDKATSTWVATLNTTSGTLVQVDQGGPFTATNPGPALVDTASFPVLPGPICANVRLIARIDWTIFQRTDPLRPRELNELSISARLGPAARVSVWSASNSLENATNYVSGPTSLAQHVLVSTAGAEMFRSTIHAPMFLTSAGSPSSSLMAAARESPKTETWNVQFVGPAFSICSAESCGPDCDRLPDDLKLTFALPLTSANSDSFHIVHLTTLGGKQAWLEDGSVLFAPAGTSLARVVNRPGIYALVQVVGKETEKVPPRSGESDVDRQR